jgi:hypothetical protein
MLKLNKTYRIFRGKETTSGHNTMLSISESSKDPQTGEWKNDGWWSVCIEGVYPCERSDEVKFTPTAFTGISQREYKGKNYITVFADGKIEYKGQTYNCGDAVKPNQPNDGSQIVGITSEDLPF